MISVDRGLGRVRVPADDTHERYHQPAFDVNVKFLGVFHDSIYTSEQEVHRPRREYRGQHSAQNVFEVHDNLKLPAEVREQGEGLEHRVHRVGRGWTACICVYRLDTIVQWVYPGCSLSVALTLLQVSSPLSTHCLKAYAFMSCAPQPE